MLAKADEGVALGVTTVETTGVLGDAE